MSSTDKMAVEIDSVKIVLVGLDNSGKTSIVLSLQKGTNLLSYCVLKPTAGVNIVNVEQEDKKFNIWDLGGQEMYRDKYLKDLDKQFVGANKILFVIDVQDVNRYENALEYLDQIMKYITENNIKVDFSIFLHKFDPGIENQKNFSEKAIATNLLDKIKKIMPKNFKYNVFKTTIYTIFQKQLLL